MSPLKRDSRSKLFEGFLLLCCSLLINHAALAQKSAPRPTPTPIDAGVLSPDKPAQSDQSPLNNFEEELRAKREIKLAEKEHEDNLSRAREIGELSKHLRELKTPTTFSREDLKKLDRLEKLTRKVRSEAGGGDEDVKIVDRPNDLASAVTQIAETAESLSKNVQKTPRQVVSASVIGTANVLLELIRIGRTYLPQN